MVSLGFGSCNLRAVLTGGDAGQTPVDAVCYASGLFRAPPFSLIDETRGSDRSVPVWVGMRFGKHLISRPVLGIGKEKRRMKLARCLESRLSNIETGWASIWSWEMASWRAS